MSTALRKKMHQDLQLAGLSEGTQDVYLRAVRQLAAALRRLGVRPSFKFT